MWNPSYSNEVTTVWGTETLVNESDTQILAKRIVCLLTFSRKGSLRVPERWHQLNHPPICSLSFLRGWDASTLLSVSCHSRTQSSGCYLRLYSTRRWAAFGFLVIDDPIALLIIQLPHWKGGVLFMLPMDKVVQPPGPQPQAHLSLFKH